MVQRVQWAILLASCITVTAQFVTQSDDNLRPLRPNSFAQCIDSVNLSERVRRINNFTSKYLKLNGHLRIAVVGDTRATFDDLGPSAYWPALLRIIKSNGATLLLHLGDWVKRGESKIEWDRWCTLLETLDIPVLSTQGNHDRGEYYHSTGLEHRDQVVKQVNVGPLRILSLNTESTPEKAQQTIAQLQSFTQHPYTIWMQHRPIWTLGNHGSDEKGWASWLIPELQRMGTDLFIAGHDHLYERSCPSIDYKNRQCRSDGILYVTSGGGGTSIVPIPGLSSKRTFAQKWQTWRHTDRFYGGRHFLLIDMSLSDHLEISIQINVYGISPLGALNLIDRFELPSRKWDQ